MEISKKNGKDYEILYDLYKDDVVGFRIWLQQALTYNRTEPLLFDKERDNIVSFLVDIYRRSKNIILQEKLFKESLLILLDDFSKHQDDVNYLFNLILISGKIRIGTAQKILSNLLFDSSMRNIILNNKELFSLTFAVLAGFRNISERTYQLFCNYIEIPEVRNICFRGIVKAHPSEAHRYINLVLNIEEKEEFTKLNFLFNSLIKDISIANFLRIFPQLIQEMNVEEMKYFLKLEFYEKYALKIDYDSGLITYWALPVMKNKKIEVNFDQKKLENNDTYKVLMALIYTKIKLLRENIKNHSSFRASLAGGYNDR